MATEAQVQEFVHRLEVGGWARGVRVAVLLAAIAAFTTYLLVSRFHGLSEAKAMDQAQVSRELARGHGFSTLMLRPAALGQIARKHGGMPKGRVPDTYNAPLNPLLNAPFVWLMRNTWSMTTKQIVYPSDRVIAGVQISCFLLAVLLNYRIASRLFDRRLAVFGAGLMLVTMPFWSYALSGLPQNLMLLIFSGCIYLLIRAMESRENGRTGLGWLAGAAAGFGLLALTHGLTVFIFIGALAFCAIVFRPVWRTLLLMIAVFTIVYSPWMVRNYRVCGNPLGTAPYSALAAVRGTESAVMRAFDVSFLREDVPTFRVKTQNEMGAQLGELYKLLGGCVAAPIFFVALMHLFKRRIISLFRWGVLLMWLSAFIGMSAVGVMLEEGLLPNNLHLLFMPLMTFYGLAFLLQLWTRLEINVPLLRYGFLTIIYLISALPMILTLTRAERRVVQWPPYVPPFIAILNTWIHEDEIITSDMPWAVAWYADRKSLWLPMKVSDFIALHDYSQLGGDMCAIYLTPVSGYRRLFPELLKGEYKEWAAMILRTAALRDFPLRALTALPLDSECVLFADRDRWSQRPD
jgi:4-amino-4-deoxy-L-arabinose transferase-like glycosyltransferase